VAFTRMDQSTPDDWSLITTECRARQAHTADAALGMLQSLRGLELGMAVDQLTHCLQTATRAERDGADDELIVAAALHDAGKALSLSNHSGIAAEFLAPYVRPAVRLAVLAHSDFEKRYYRGAFGADPTARKHWKAKMSAADFAMAERFADEWDQQAFDPAYDTLPLEHFEPMVRKVFASARY
jgi:predicted HD phosphohydrolase